MMSTRDLNLYFGDTFVSIDEDGVRKPVHLLEVFEDGAFIGKIRKGVARWPRGTINVRFNTLNLDWPKMGLFNLGNTVIHMERRVRRQVSRSFRSNLVTHKTVSPELESVLGTKVFPFSPPSLKKIFNPEYLTVEESLEEISRGRVARAVSPEIWIGRHIRHKDLVFGYKGWVVGRLDGDSFILDHECESLLPLIEETLPDVGVGSL